MMKLMSKSEWDGLIERINQLEQREIPVPTIRRGYVSSSALFGGPRYRVNVTHQDLLLKILSHLGLEFEPVEASPADVKLIKRPKSR